MAFSSWRGTLGLIKASLRPGSLEETIRLLPEGIGVIPMTAGIRKGDSKEFKEVIKVYEERVAELAEYDVDVIEAAGAPPFMALGYDGERELVAEWEEKYGKPVLTSGIQQVAALKALGATTLVGATYFPEEMNKQFAQYFRDAGFTVLSMEGVDVQFNQVQRLSSREVYAFTKAAYLRNQEADLIYMMGGGWRVLDIAQMLEDDFEVPVLQGVMSRVWAIQKHFHANQRHEGMGRLLGELPAWPDH